MKSSDHSKEIVLYRLCPPKFWDRRFSVVIEGMLGGDGWNEITRAGPFVPPMSFPTNSIVVTSSFKDRLDKAGLGVFKYRPVIKQHIVDLPWHEWDRSALPRGLSLPRDIGAYLESASHSASCAERMEDLWELLLPKGPKAWSYNPAGRWAFPELKIIDRGTVGRRHICESQGISLYVLSAKAKDWLAAEAGEWVSFEPLYFVPPPRPPFVMVNMSGRVVDNPTREQALDYVGSLGPDGEWSLRLINSRDWYIHVKLAGTVELGHVTASYQRVRRKSNAPRVRQVELWMAFFDRDIDRLMAEDWEIEQNPKATGPAGPGTVEY